ncbi:MAG: hypothetical protein LC118_05135 [Dehalococcoidia bacterium]|nr:hypothetical protein [Dehalococcoidia bacterium]
MKTHLRRRSWAVGLAALLAVLIPVASVSDAGAAEVRVQAWNRYDVLLSGWETATAASSLAGAARVCALTVIPAALGRGGAPAAVIAGTACVSMVSVCSIRAKLRGRWAGFTVRPWGTFWCWDY